jgi:hypothetical protein
LHRVKGRKGATPVSKVAVKGTQPKWSHPTEIREPTVKERPGVGRTVGVRG